MNKLGVIQVIDALNAGGAEVLAVNIANALLEKGINSHLCTTRKEGILKKNLHSSVGYLFLNRKKSLDLFAVIQFKKYLKKHNISIIHAHSTSSFFAFCVKLICPKVKIIWHDHYGESQKLNARKRFPLNVFSFFYKSIISVNNQLKKWAKEKLYCKEVFFLNNFSYFNNKESITKLKGIEGKKIVHLAGFRAQKDHITLLKGFKIFLENNKDWTLHLVGKIYNDAYSNSILEFIKINNLEKNVFTYDACLDIKNILKQSSIGILSSKSEGLPVSVLEYGLASLPVIVTDVGECAKVVKNNLSGIVIKPNTTQLISKALTTLATSSKKRQQFSKLHNDNVSKYYSKELFIKELLLIYTN